MGLAAGIIMIFIIMVAFFISYGKTFKMKNEIINAIEQKEGMTASDLTNFVAGKNSAYVGKKIGACYNKIKNSSGNYVGFTVEVVVYMEMDRTILGTLFNPKIPVTGETKLIEKGNYHERFISGISNPLGMNECSSGGYTTIQNIT